MKNFISRVINSEMNGKDFAIVIGLILSLLIGAVFLLKSMGVHFVKM